MTYSFAKKKVLVTGGTRGIGAAIAKAFIACDAEVYYTGQSPKPSHRVDTANYIQLDFSSDKSVGDFLNLSEIKNIDILINNAGINKIAPFHEIDAADFRLVQKVNTEGPFLITQQVVKGMIERNYGRIVNIASIFSAVSKEYRTSYSTSKTALVGMTKALAIEVASKNILVNLVSPGFIDTELTRAILTDSQIQELTSQVPAKRLGKADEIAELVLFLTSHKNTFITGQNIIADGGFTCV